MLVACSSLVGSFTIISSFLFEQETSKKINKNEINKFFNILDKL